MQRLEHATDTHMHQPLLLQIHTQQEEVSEQPQGFTTIIVILLLYKQQNMSEVQITG